MHLVIVASQMFPDLLIQTRSLEYPIEMFRTKLASVVVVAGRNGRPLFHFTMQLINCGRWHNMVAASIVISKNPTGQIERGKEQPTPCQHCYVSC